MSNSTGNLSNALFNRLDRLYWFLVEGASTLAMRLVLTGRNVHFGKGNRFFGLTTVKRSSASTFRIGSHCTFRSTRTSNLIGVNRPCMLSALSPEARLIIGDHVGLSGTVIGCFSEIRIGNHVKCGANTLITDGDWHTEDPRSGAPRPIVIGDNVWLGVNVTVLKGVTIGENSIIGAGSVVTKNIPPHVIAAGNPCRVIKEL